MLFQSPSLRGSGRFRIRYIVQGVGSLSGFNPLHCGAVVASFELRYWVYPSVVSFNPLHCGAVVASLGINFLAREQFCFNPLHCGAVVASRLAPRDRDHRRAFQSPSLRGSGRFTGHAGPGGAGVVWFQSPSLRGSGRFRPARASARPPRRCFNPLHCGAVVASRAPPTPPVAPRRVSIPFIAGQWSLPSDKEVADQLLQKVSIPFIAGQWSLPDGYVFRRAEELGFQSPSLRGSGRFSSSPP